MSISVKSLIDDATSSVLSIFNPNALGTQSSISALQYPMSIKGSEDRHSSYLVFYAVKAMVNKTASSNKSPSAISSQAYGFNTMSTSANSASLSSQGVSHRQSRAMAGNFREQTLCAIQMYVPNMMESMNHNFDKQEGSFVQDMILSMRDALSSGKDLPGKFVDAATAATQQAVKQIGISVGGALQAYNPQITGVTLGDRGAQMYNGTSVRQQNFTYQFRPRSLAELKEVGKILYSFLKYSSATNIGSASLADVTRVGGSSTESVGVDKAADAIRELSSDTEGYSVIEVPPLWYIEERINKHAGNNPRYTPKFAFGPAALTSVRINKTPEQIYETFSGTAGDSIAIDMDLTFTELRPIYSNYWDLLCGEGGSKLGEVDSGNFFFGSGSSSGG